MNKRFLRTVTTVAVLILSIAVYYLKNDGAVNIAQADDSFNRNLTPVIYTKHARCRMGCRNIDESEVMEILHHGKINYNKSDLNGKPDPKYALEGYTHDNQDVRIIFAPSKKGMVVITCIDVKEEWKCDCK